MRDLPLKLVWVNPSLMASPNPRRSNNDSEPSLGREGTLKHFLFYCVAAIFLSTIVVYLTNTVGGWRDASRELAQSRTIEEVLNKSIVPTLTKELNKTIDDRFSNLENNRLEPVRKQLSDLQRDVTKLQGDLTNLEKWLPVAEYKAQAKKLGIRDPQIIPVTLKPTATFTAIYNFGEANRNAEVQYILARSEDKFVVITRTKFIENGVVISEPPAHRSEFMSSTNRFNFAVDFKLSSGKASAVTQNRPMRVT